MHRFRSRLCTHCGKDLCGRVGVGVWDCAPNVQTGTQKMEHRAPRLLSHPSDPERELRREEMAMPERTDSSGFRQKLGPFDRSCNFWTRLKPL